MTNLSIIICTRNRVNDLRRTLNAMCAVIIPGGLHTELLVVDNGSTDKTGQVAQDVSLPNMRFEYEREDHGGQACARNRGLAEAQGEIIIFLDDDVRPDVNWLSRMCRPMLDRGADAVQGEIRIAAHLKRPWMTKTHAELLASTEHRSGDDVPYLVGANFGFRREVLERVPSFDPELGPGALGFSDDGLFSQQVREAGFSMRFVKEAAVDHHFDAARLSRGAFRDRAYRDGRSRAYVSYHWLHEDYEDVEQKLRAIKQALLRHHLRHPAGLLGFGVMDEAEFWLYIMLGFWEQTLIERRRPRRYAKRGLTLLSDSAQRAYLCEAV